MSLRALSFDFFAPSTRAVVEVSVSTDGPELPDVSTSGC